MGQSSTTTQRADPWDPAQPYILEGLNSAQNMWNNDPNQFVIQPWQGNATAAEDQALQAARNQIGGFQYQRPVPQPSTTIFPSNDPPSQPPVGGGGGGGQPPDVPLDDFGNPMAGFAPTQPVNNAAPQTLPPPSGNGALQAPVAPQAAPSGLTPQPQPLGGFLGQQRAALGNAQGTAGQVMSDSLNAPTTSAFNQGVAGAQQGTNARAFDSAVNSATNDPLGNGLRERIRQNVAEGVMPNISATFGNSGMTGSSLQAAAAAKGMASGLAPYELQAVNSSLDRSLQAGGMAQGALEGARDRSLAAGTASQNALTGSRGQALQAAGMAPGLSEGAYRPLDRQAEVGQARTQEAQQQLIADIMANQQAQTGPIDAINNYLSLTSNLGSQFGTSASTAQNNPGLMGMLGGGVQGLGLLSMLSDRRAKENIRRVGQTDSGLAIYIYNYIGNAMPQMGVMAQEVEKVLPDAVSMRPDGFKQVNYGMLEAI